jgi:hypothetical protein
MVEQRRLRSELQCAAAARVCGVLWWARVQEQSGDRLIGRLGHPRCAAGGGEEEGTDTQAPTTKEREGGVRGHCWASGVAGPSARWRRRQTAATCGRRKGFAGRLSAREKRERREEWAYARKGRPKGKKGSRPGCLGWDLGLLFYFLLFSFSNPFETHLYLNSNRLLNSNPVHSFQ